MTHAAPAVLALASAVTYGVGDFLGGEGSRRFSAVRLALLVQSTGLVVAGVAVVVTARDLPPAAALGWGALSGIGSAAGNLALYQGLSSGAMNVVAPLSGVLTAIVPAVVGVATGDTVAPGAAIGLVIAVPAIALVSMSPGGAAGTSVASRLRTGVGWGALAGCGFGLLFVALDQAGTGHGAWPLVPSQAVAIAMVVATMAFRRLRASASDSPTSALTAALPWGLAAGVCGIGANLLFFAATDSGELAVVGVLSSLYPTVTVVLATVLLRERTTRVQVFGLVVAAIAVVLITSA